MAAMLAAGGCGRFATSWSAPAATSEQAVTPAASAETKATPAGTASVAKKPPAAGVPSLSRDGENMPSERHAGHATPDNGAASAPTPPVGPATRAYPKNPTPLVGFVDPLTKEGQRVPVTLDGCIRRALANNLTIQVARYGPPIARTNVRQAEAIFDPSWFLNNALGRIKQEAGSFFAGAAVSITRQWDFATGVQGLLPTGGTWQISQDWTWLRSNNQFISPNPQYDGDLVLSVTQPLLRGGGIEYTRSPIVLARLDERISVAEFRGRLMAIVLEVERTYWDLVVAETQVQALSEALAAAQENLRIARRRFEEGKDKRVIVSLAESAVTTRQADLVAARLRLAQTSDRLKRFVNDRELPMTDPAVLAATELPVAEPIPVLLPMFHQSIAAAMVNRPEIQEAEARLAQAGVKERMAWNQRLPQLDLAASYGFNGLATDLDRSIDKEFETRWFDWSVRVDFSVPLGNRARRAAYEQSQLVQDQTLKAREDVRQQVLLDVSTAIRDLASAEEAVRARRAARQAAEQVVQDGEAFVSAGAALLKDLLDAQRDLADAKVREMEAMAAYMVGLANLERAKGTLLEYNDIRLIEERTGPQPVVGK
jgi:outer membrane protein